MQSESWDDGITISCPAACTATPTCCYCVAAPTRQAACVKNQASCASMIEKVVRPKGNFRFFISLLRTQGACVLWGKRGLHAHREASWKRDIDWYQIIPGALRSIYFLGVHLAGRDVTIEVGPVVFARLYAAAEMYHSLFVMSWACLLHRKDVPDWWSAKAMSLGHVALRDMWMLDPEFEQEAKGDVRLLIKSTRWVAGTVLESFSKPILAVHQMHNQNENWSSRACGHVISSVLVSVVRQMHQR